MLDFLLAHRLLPDALLRRCIRRRLAGRLRRKTATDESSHRRRIERFAEALGHLPVDPGLPEMPASPAFLGLCLGPRLLQSCCWFERGQEPIAAAEEAMLRLTAIRARIEDGQSILDLEAGWGSRSLWLALRYPHCRITAACRSAARTAFVATEAARLGLANVAAITVDLNAPLPPGGPYDRVLAIELLERLKNWPRLLEAVAATLRPDGFLFAQLLTHQRLAYHLEPPERADWLGRRFRPGAMIPCDELLSCFPEEMRILQHWRVDGRHYQHTAERWLENLDRNHASALAELATLVGSAQAPLALANWRLFFLICAERGGFRLGGEWRTSHYLLQPTRRTTRAP